jgi:uncharacterized protein YbjT (DUF2867 family)
MDVLVIGGRGTLGKHVCADLAARGHRVRPAGRRDRLADARADAIVNCAGASVALAPGHGWRGYGAIDVPVGLAAVELARQWRARLVYVAVQHPPALAACTYVAAHERVAASIRDIDGCVVRATGFFAAFAALLPLARRGWLVDVGDGRARTNPIDERDLATVVVDALLGGAREIAAGGPDVMTRAQLFEQVAAAAERRVRIVRAPVWLSRAGAAALRIVHPRIGQFAQFATYLARHDVIAPVAGARRLVDYLAAEAFTARAASSAR